MRKTVLISIMVAILMLTGCGNKKSSANMTEGNHKDLQILSSSINTNAKQFSGDIVPDWLYQSLQQKFNHNTSIAKENITFVQVNLNKFDKPQVAAFVSIDRLNGYFLLYEFREGKYVEVFSKSEPVYGLQVYGGGKQLIGFTSGLGGTGIQENTFHLIGYTNKGYLEVWSGIAEKLEFGQAPHFRTIGSINLTMDNQTLVYLKAKEVYNKIESDIGKPDKVEETVELYRYSPEEEKFVIITKLIPGGNDA